MSEKPGFGIGDSGMVCGPAGEAPWRPIHAGRCLGSPLPSREAEESACRLPVAADALWSPSEAKAGWGRGGGRSRRGFSPSPQPLSLKGRGARSQASFGYRSLALERQDPIGAERFPSSPFPWRERGWGRGGGHLRRGFSPLPNPSPSRGEGLEVRRPSDTRVSPSNAKIRSVRSDSRAPLSPRGRGARCVALFRYRRPGFARSIELRRLVRDAVVAKRGTRFGWGAFARPVAPRAGTRAGDILFAACAMMRGPEDH
jgi:hypothetical protein